MQKVREGAALIEKEGESAFNKFRGDSEFVFNGTYVWIHDLEGVMHVHPIKFKMENTNLLNLKDPTGKLIFIEMNELVEKNNEGWVEYMWPRPGQDKPSKKVSFVKKAVYKGKVYVLGCGVYDSDISKITK